MCVSVFGCFTEAATTLKITHQNAVWVIRKSPTFEFKVRQQPCFRISIFFFFLFFFNLKFKNDISPGLGYDWLAPLGMPAQKPVIGPMAGRKRRLAVYERTFFRQYLRSS